MTGLLISLRFSIPLTIIFPLTIRITDLAHMFLATQNEDFLEISKANEANTADKTVATITRII